LVLICVYNFKKQGIVTVKVETDVSVPNEEYVIGMGADEVCKTPECDPEVSHILR